MVVVLDVIVALSILINDYVPFVLQNMRKGGSPS